MTAMDRLIEQVRAQSPAEAAQRKAAHLAAKRRRRACQGRSQASQPVCYVWEPWSEPQEICWSDLSEQERDEIKGLSEPAELTEEELRDWHECDRADKKRKEK